MMTPELIEFIRRHEGEDTDGLLLAARRYPGVDVCFAVEQIIARKVVRDKLPEWHARREIAYPSRLAAEQCSSETTARYKQRLVAGETLCDLTGGLGVDSYYLSRVVRRVVYVERSPEYVETAARNFEALGAGNIECVAGDAYDVAEGIAADTFYLDPARRTGDNRRVFALEDCEPDVSRLKPLLLGRCRRVIVKISPMADLSETLRLLPETREIHVLAVRNECKELLFVLEEGFNRAPVPVHAVNFASRGTQSFRFTLEEEREAEAPLAPEVGAYLYEPNAAILKSGAFKTPALRYGLAKLERHSHLYTSSRFLPDFPGRVFAVERTLDFSGKRLKVLAQSLPQANITVRNFPLTVAGIRAKSGIRDGGDAYLFATTLHPRRLVLVVSRKI